MLIEAVQIMGSLGAAMGILVQVEGVWVLLAVELFDGLTVIVDHAAQVLKLALVVLLDLGLVVLGVLQLEVLVETALRPRPR